MSKNLWLSKGRWLEILLLFAVISLLVPIMSNPIQQILLDKVAIPDKPVIQPLQIPSITLDNKLEPLTSWLIDTGFESANHAKQTLQKLQQHGFAAYILSIDNSKHVVIGPIINLHLALMMAKKLHQQLHIQGQVKQVFPGLEKRNIPS